MDRATRSMVITTAVNGIAVGATLDQAIKQLPARRRIGVTAYLDYARSADLGNGLRWYPVVGVGTAATSLTAALTVLHDDRDIARRAGSMILLAATVSHMVATSLAAPTMIALRHGSPAPEAISAALDRFARLNAFRAAAMVGALMAAAWTATRSREDRTARVLQTTQG